MKRSLLSGLGLLLLTSVQLAGCATDDDGGECLPGDIDCAAPATGDGKADGWDYKNDPARMSQRLTYKLSELPRKGKLTTPVWKAQYPSAVPGLPVAWADTYWPTADGSHNTRWQGASVKSPLEKYDQAFNNAAGCATQPTALCGEGSKAAWDTYYACSGPAAKWQSKEFQGAGQMHDGLDNNSDGKKDECSGEDGNDGVATWWGTCHAWAPAALLAPEPQHEVTINGVTFTPGDIKALTQNAFDSTSAIMLGGRCNAKEITHDVAGSANTECSDVNPGALHVIMTNFLGLAQLPLVEDRTANFEVWNQPVLGYEVTKQAVVSKTAANTCVGQTTNKTKWSYNTAAAKLYEVRMRVDYLTESSASDEPQGFANNTSNDDVPLHPRAVVGGQGHRRSVLHRQHQHAHRLPVVAHRQPPREQPVGEHRKGQGAAREVGRRADPDPDPGHGQGVHRCAERRDPRQQPGRHHGRRPGHRRHRPRGPDGVRRHRPHLPR